MKYTISPEQFTGLDANAPDHNYYFRIEASK
jgi:hypothetical protein